MDKGTRVLIDTCAIIEAYRVNCWNNLHSFFSLETSAECISESATKPKNKHGYVPIDNDHLLDTIKVHNVTDQERIDLLFELDDDLNDLDPGERDLLAYAITQPSNVYLLCSPDKACMRAAKRLNVLDRIVSLESLCERVGRKNLHLEENYTEKWHKRIYNEILFG